MAPRPFSCYDYWSYDHVASGTDPDQVQVSCLLPNGPLIEFYTSRSATMQDIKDELWEIAEKYPRYGYLQPKQKYKITAIVSNGTLQTVSDEGLRICDLKPYFCLFKISECEVSDNALNQKIRELIGKEDNFSNPEYHEFRFKMSIIAERVSQERQKMTWVEKVMYQYPPRIANNREIPETVCARFRDNKFVLVAKFEKVEAEASFTFQIQCDHTPNQVIEQILAKRALLTKKQFTRNRTRDYILKVCGQDEYLLGEYPIVQFLYIQDTLSRNAVPTVTTQPIESLNVFKDVVYQSPQSLGNVGYRQGGGGDVGYGGYDTAIPTTLRKRKESILSWDIAKSDKFQCKISSLNGIYGNKGIEFGILVGLFHGGKSLCEPQKLQEKTLEEGDQLVWDEPLTFDIWVGDVPRMARLCLVVYDIVKSVKGGSTKTKRGKESSNINPLYWVNTTIFDYRSQLKTGAVTLYLWPYAEDTQSEDLLHPLGTVEPNPRRPCTSVMMSFDDYGHRQTIVYPSVEQIVTHAKHLQSTGYNSDRDSAQDSRTITEIIGPYLNNDRMHDMHEQERDAIWKKRADCFVYEPEGLPCLLFCINWNNRNEISEITNLLLKWKPVSIERALELLDYAYADQNVRRFAVRCLRSIRDEELLLYLLQLVQAIKHESYLHCDLVEFLLDRALKNQRIGHYLFWHLKSEMDVPSVQARFYLILEAYLYGCQEHIATLERQLKCLQQLREGSEVAKKATRDKRNSKLQEFFGEAHVREVLSNLVSPLHPSFRWKSIRTDKCKVMDSKMRPLWVVFENADVHGDDIYVIFKNGDDLRQDMLTIQMLRIMDRIWKSQGYDFRMNPYSCISTERRLGMIEVVLNAETIAKIQKEKGIFSATSAFKKGSLHAWLREHNNSDEAFQRAITEFTYSCAGYCVATYVLGIADRHSDNIMVKRTGQLFHIDFGHILGHFKEKFGFRRERVPFVLTYDFVYVINNGRTDRETDEFRTFQDLCERAFIILRQHGCLILSLFAMMISTGLPELSSEKDLNYLRETLVLDLPESEAREHFRSKFNEALANSWKTSLNWASHNFSRNNNK